MQWILLFVFLLVLAGAGAGAAHFLLKPSATKLHPQYGNDCDALLDVGTQTAVEPIAMAEDDTAALINQRVEVTFYYAR